MTTPLAKARGLGAAHRGTETFWRQRMTAVANIPLVIFLILSIVTHIGADYLSVGGKAPEIVLLNQLSDLSCTRYRAAVLKSWTNWGTGPPASGRLRPRPYRSRPPPGAAPPARKTADFLCFFKAFSRRKREQSHSVGV